MIVQEILTAQSDPQEELDTILAELCELVLNGQDRDTSVATKNPKLQELCKRLADTFLNT